MRKKATLLLVLAAAAAGSLTCTPLYVLRAGIEEGKILSRRRPIMELVDDPATSAETRRKLRLVLEARTFAREALGLAAGSSYTSYSWVDRDTLALVVSAARRDRFQQLTWWFPIVGHVPYKGFFSARAAQRAAEELEQEGYDTYVRPTSAFSTLGWFSDPLLSTLLRASDVNLVSTVIHELTHNSLFLPGQVGFNESFASFVGERGAILFFCSLEGQQGQRCQEAERGWADNLRFAAFLSDLIRELETLYARADLSFEQRLGARETVFQRARSRFAAEVEPALETSAYRGFGRLRWNNALLIARRVYHDRLHLFEAAWQRAAGDLPAAVRAIRAAARRSPADPFAALGQLAGG
ncbi:MAG: aminopeptidase [Gemmatimonadetes bacterium]|nr:aminopeptidase [Gemmatimonadota bacterium]